MELTKKEFKELKNRNPEVFERIYNRHKNQIFNYIMVMSSNSIDISEEVFSETIHSAFESVIKLKNCKNILGWFIRIAKNKYNDYLRRIYKDKRIINNIKTDIAETSEMHKDYIELSDDSTKLKLLKISILNLKPHYKEIINLKYFKKLSHQEIAAKLTISRDASESMLQRAVSALKKEMRKLSNYI